MRSFTLATLASLAFAAFCSATPVFTARAPSTSQSPKVARCDDPPPPDGSDTSEVFPATPIAFGDATKTMADNMGESLLINTILSTPITNAVPTQFSSTRRIAPTRMCSFHISRQQVTRYRCPHGLRCVRSTCLDFIFGPRVLSYPWGLELIKCINQFLYSPSSRPLHIA